MKKYRKLIIIFALLLFVIILAVALFKSDNNQKSIEYINLPFIENKTSNFQKKENINGKLYISNIDLSKNQKIEEIIINDSIYKVIGADIDLVASLFKNLKNTKFSIIDFKNSKFNLKNDLLNLIISGQFKIEKTDEEIFVSSEEANIKSDFFDLTADISYKEDKTNIKIIRGFISNNIISSFNIDGEINIYKDKTFDGVINAKAVSINDIDLKEVSLVIKSKENGVVIEAESKKGLNNFNGVLTLEESDKKNISDVSLMVNIEGKENIDLDLKGEIPTTISIENILEEGFLKGYVNVETNNFDISQFMDDASVELSGDIEVAKDKLIIKSDKEIILNGDIISKYYLYLSNKLKHKNNKIRLKPLKDDLITLQIKPYLKIEKTNVELSNASQELLGQINNFSINDNELNLDFKNVKTVSEKKDFIIHNISGKMSGDINDVISGKVKIKGDMKNEKFSIKDISEDLSFKIKRDGKVEKNIESFKAKELTTINPKIVAENISFIKDGEGYNFLANNINSEYKIFSPLKLKGALSNDGNIKAILDNSNVKFDLIGKNSDKKIDLELSSGRFPFNDITMPVLKGKIRQFISGSVIPSVKLNINKKDYAFNGSSYINFEQITFDDEKYALSSFDYNLKVDKLFPLQMSNQTIKSAMISFKGIDLFSTEIIFSILNNILQVHKAESTFGGGDLSVDPFSVDLSNNEIDFAVAVDNVKTQSVLDLAKLQHLKSTGYLNGLLPFVYNFRDNSYSLLNGALFSTEKGNFSYKHIPIGDMSSPSLNVELTRDALADYQFDNFQLFIDKEQHKKGAVRGLFRGFSPHFVNGKRSALNLDLSPIFERLFK